MRLFIAIDIPAPQKDCLLALHDDLKDAHWVKRQALHLTLKFIGEVENAVFEQTKKILADVKCPAFSLKLNGVGCFGNKKFAQVLWVGVMENPLLIQLQKKIDDILAQKKIALPDKRPYVPHLTLSRLKKTPAHTIQPFLNKHKLLALEPFEVNEFCLYSSKLTAEGAVHTQEGVYGLM